MEDGMYIKGELPQVKISLTKSSFKVKSAQKLCSSNHVARITELETMLARQAEMLEEVADKVAMIFFCF